jgi:hypothetical protein
VSSSPLYNEKFRRPVVAFTELLRKGSGGVFKEVGQYSAFMFRALVLAVDVEGGKLETPDATVHRRGEKDWEPGGTVLHQRVVGTDGVTLIAEYDVALTSGPVNPANSIRARIIGSNIDQFIGDDDLRCYWPMFPGFDNPSPGELVYVVFEDEEYTHGLWLARVPTNNANQTANQVVLSQLGQSIQSGAAQAFKDTNTSSSNADGSPRRDYSQRLTNLFIK